MWYCRPAKGLVTRDLILNFILVQVFGIIKPKILTLFWFEENEMWTLPTIFNFWSKEHPLILIQYLSSTDQTFSSYSLLSLLCQKVYHCSTLGRSSGHAAIFKCYAGRTIQNLIKLNYLSIKSFSFSEFETS